MPRTADRKLEDRILRAAQRLWRSHGEKALTLRAVAREAATTTTTVYKRFRNKEALRFAVAERVYKQITLRVTSATRTKHVYRRYLDFAERHPWEYRLLFGPVWTEILGPGRPRSIKTWLLDRLAAQYGGKPKQYQRVYYALFFAAHGAAALLAATPHSRANRETRRQCLAVCDALVKNIKLLRRPN
ncbi:MAG: TetR/AcrR family transcriptional regulator [Acidobacteriia bacterium]|nr:TetR/AcrR family transcriptional regulator [Terriglobia bacterium]